MKASGVKPQWMGDDEWACWQEYWRDPFVQDMAAKNRANRLTEARDGTGTSRHHYGSRAVVTDRQMSVSIYVISDLQYALYLFFLISFLTTFYLFACSSAPCRGAHYYSPPLQEGKNEEWHVD